MSARDICAAHTRLTADDVERLVGMEANLQLIANLTASDVFIDCMDRTGREAVVVAQARPEYGRASLYQGSVVGMPVLRENEPAVFHALESGCPVRDLKAITQENVSVKQDVVPIMGTVPRQVVGVLIRERDISDSILQEKKFYALARREEDRGDIGLLSGSDLGRAAVRETHHRVKNSLQLVASIMNLQARQSDVPEVRRIFEENNARVLSIAATHDIISMSGTTESVSLADLLLSVARNLEVIASVTRRVGIAVVGQDTEVNPDVASSVALVANELILNAVQHGYREGEGGHVSISVRVGELRTNVCIEDDGRGFDAEVAQEHLGLRLVRLTVQDKLGGDFLISSSDKGTQASFSFKNKI